MQVLHFTTGLSESYASAIIFSSKSANVKLNFFIFLCCFCFIFFRFVRLGKYCSLLFVEAQQKASCLGICVAGKRSFYRN